MFISSEARCAKFGTRERPGRREISLHRSPAKFPPPTTSLEEFSAFWVFSSPRGGHKPRGSAFRASDRETSRNKPGGGTPESPLKWWQCQPRARRAEEALCTGARGCPTPCDPTDTGFARLPVPGIFHAWILAWGAIPFFRGSSWPRDWTCIFRIGRRVLHPLTHLESPAKRIGFQEVRCWHGCLRTHHCVKPAQGSSVSFHAWSRRALSRGSSVVPRLQQVLPSWPLACPSSSF